MYLTETSCCALAHLDNVRNDDTAEEIVSHVKVMEKNGYYQKCLFAVTTPEEKVLPKTLESIGFKKSFLFPRTEYSGTLTLWIALFSDIKLKPKAVKRKSAKRKPRKTR